MAPYPHVLYYCSTISLRCRGGLAPASNVCELGSITSPLFGEIWNRTRRETAEIEPFVTYLRARRRCPCSGRPSCEPGFECDLLKKPLSIYLVGIGLKGNSKLTGNSLRPFGTQKKVLGEFRPWSRVPHYLGIETIENLSATDDLALIQTEKSLF